MFLQQFSQDCTGLGYEYETRQTPRKALPLYIQVNEKYDNTTILSLRIRPNKITTTEFPALLMQEVLSEF